MNLATRSLIIFFSLYLGACSSQNFSHKIESNDHDLLSEESFMRYSTQRIDYLDSKSNDIISKSLLACHQHKFIKGMSALEYEMQNFKSNPFYWNALGTCYSLKKEFNKALFFFGIGKESLEKIKDQTKYFAEAMIENNIGLIHLNFHRYNESYDCFKKASSLAPSLITPKFNIAQLYIEFGENDKALELLKSLSSINLSDVDVLYSLSLVYLRNNDLKNSYSMVKKIKNDYLNRPDIVGLYAYNLMLNKEYPAAKEILEKRSYASDFDDRNKLILDEINLKIKEQSRTQKN